MYVTLAPRLFRKLSPRWLSSGAKQSTGQVRFVPFRLSMDDAVDVYHSWCESQPMAPLAIQKGGEHPRFRKLLIPFWAISSTVRSSAWTSSYPQPHSSVATYEQDLPISQVYASALLPRDLVHVAKLPLSLGRFAYPPSDDVELDTWSLSLERAKVVVRRRVKRLEEKRVINELQCILQSQRRPMLGAEVSVQFMEMVSFQVYFPVFEFTYEYMGTTYTAVINGVDARVGALEQYSFGKMAAALSFVGTAIITQQLGHMPSTLPWIGGVFIPACCLAYAASRYAKIIQQLREKGTLHEYQELFQGPEDEDEEEAWAKQYRKRDERRGARYREDYENRTTSSVGSAHTLLYDQLGVVSGASLDEISRAFRKLALRHHPDRQQNEISKRDSERILKKVVAAYQVLRDPVKRAHYDRTGEMS